MKIEYSLINNSIVLFGLFFHGHVARVINDIYEVIVNSFDEISKGLNDEK